MTPTPAEPATTDRPPAAAGAAGPDWQARDEPVPCPLCGYDLRGLPAPRCPECGYRFEWTALLDPSKRLHPYLFEHHPGRDVRSLVRTMVGGLLPRRFWRSLRPEMPSRPGRLLFYWLVAALLGLVAVVTEAGRSAYEAARLNELQRSQYLRFANSQPMLIRGQPNWTAGEIQKLGGPQAWVDRRLPPTLSRKFFERWYLNYRQRDRITLSLGPPLMYLAWPWLTLATLMVFRASMRRAKVRTVHVLRCVLYSCDAGVWLVPLAALASMLSMAAIAPLAYSELLSRRGDLILAALIFAAYTTYRLGAAYALYLHFHLPLATALAAQLIVLLGSITLLMLNAP